MVREIRAVIGDRPLRLEVNGAWYPATARALIPRFEEYGIDAWEDPCETYEKFAEIRDVTALAARPTCNCRRHFRGCQIRARHCFAGMPTM